MLTGRASLSAKRQWPHVLHTRSYRPIKALIRKICILLLWFLKLYAWRPGNGRQLNRFLRRHTCGQKEDAAKRQNSGNMGNVESAYSCWEVCYNTTDSLPWIRWYLLVCHRTVTSWSSIGRGRFEWISCALLEMTWEVNISALCLYFLPRLPSTADILNWDRSLANRGTVGSHPNF